MSSSIKNLLLLFALLLYESWYIFLLTTSSEILIVALWVNPFIPWGTCLTWVALMCFPLVFVQIGKIAGIPRKDSWGNWYYNLLAIAFLGGFTWIFVSYWLARGDLAFNFVNDPYRAKLFRVNSYALPVLSLLAVLYWWLVWCTRATVRLFKGVKST